MLRHIATKTLVPGMALLLGACSLLPEPQPVQSWTLQPVRPTQAGEVQVSDLRVLRPQTQDLLSGRYLLVVPEGQPVSVYKDARWSGSIPVLWRDYLVAALQQDSRFARISGDEVLVGARHELVSRLDAFQTEYMEGQPVVVLRAYLQLVDTRTRAILAERPLTLSQPVAGRQVGQVVAAFDQLMNAASVEIRNWLLAVQTES